MITINVKPNTAGSRESSTRDQEAALDAYVSIRAHDVRMPPKLHPNVCFAQKAITYVTARQKSRVKRFQRHRPATIRLIGAEVHHTHAATERRVL
jgi:hypothetical protein